MVKCILKLIEGSEKDVEPELDDREAALHDLPEPVRAAILNNDVRALQATLAALPEDAARAIIERLQAAGIIGDAPPPDRPRPNIDQVIQQFLPLLGDIALAAFGDDVARQLAEAVLPQLEQGGWQLGERDAEQITEGIAPHSAALVRRTLRLVADGPGMIFAASSLQIANLRRQAAGQAAQQLGAPWRDLGPRTCAG